MECKLLAKELVGDQCNLGYGKDLSMERLWAWSKKERLDNDRDAYLRLDKCFDSEKDIWFD